MKELEAHTPTWKVIEISTDKNPFRYAISNGVTRLVQYVDRGTAEKIVGAVTAYDEDQRKIAALLEAAKIGLKALRGEPLFPDESNSSSIQREVIPQLKRAIAQAEARP